MSHENEQVSKEYNDKKGCPLQKKYGDIICIDGTLWGLTYNECAPPDQRQALGPCHHCSTERKREKKP